MLRLSCFALFVLSLCASASQAAMIPNAITGIVGIPYTQGDSNTFDGDGNIQRVFNGSGLNVGDPLNPATWTHISSWQNGWQSNSGTANGSLIADLGSIQSQLASMYLWNVTEGQGASVRGVASIDVYYSSVPTTTPTLNTPYTFASGGWTLLASNVPVTQGLETGASPVNAIVDLSTIPAARYIGIMLKGNYSAGASTRVGLAEVQITTAVAVPEPTSLIGIGLVALGGVLVRRRRIL